MKYIKQADGSFLAYDETSKEFELLSNLDEKRRPAFLNEKDKEVITYLAAQAEAAKLAQDQAIEQSAIDEVIRDQFSKQIAERVAKKKAELEKQRKG